MKSYKYRNKIYTVKNCTLNDIPSHLEKVLSYYDADEVTIQKNRMELAIYNGTAYKLVDESNITHTFFYYEFNSEKHVSGIALWWSSFRLFFIFGLWFRPHTMIQYFYIVPHNSNFIPFECLVENEYIEDYKKNKDSLVINIWSPKCERIVPLIKQLGIEETI